MSGPVVIVDRFGRERIPDDDDIVRDGERVRVSMTAMDALQRSVFESRQARRRPNVRIVDARQEAYRLCVIDDENAYRRPDGAYPLSAGENTMCTINGRSGHLRQAKNGEPWLVWVPDQNDGSAPPPSASMKRRSDARFVDEREVAYREVEARDANAWQSPPFFGVSK
jgi:hypothetical protein